MQCSNLNTHSSKCMILLECLHDHLRSRVLTDSLSHSPKPRMRIIILLVCGQPSDVCIYIYISIGPLRRLIYYLFVDYPPMNINWAAPTIDIFNLDYPPIINVFRQPSEPFSLDSSHALTRIILGCSSAYGMHVFQFQYSLITCKYVNMHILT